MLGEKDGEGILAALLHRAASVVCAPVPSPRALEPARLAEIARLHATGPVEVADDVATALDAAIARAGPRDLVLVTGSTYLAGAARTAARRLGFTGSSP